VLFFPIGKIDAGQAEGACRCGRSWSREFRDHHGAQSILPTLPGEIAKRAARVKEMAS
jgi:hypothetical protein